MTDDTVLRIDDLHVRYANGVHAVRGVCLQIARGECVALVGESGCGKTTIARAALGLLPKATSIIGTLRVGDIDIVGADANTVRRLRGKLAGYVPQDPFAACDPRRRVGHHVGEAWRAHGERPPAGAVVALVEDLGIEDGARRIRGWPHQWSGGMLQRATVAAAAAHRPMLIVADEPTSALDADRAGDILRAIREASPSVLLVSHDLMLVAAHADRVAVIYAGRIVELGWPADVIKRPRHPYSRALLAAVPRPGAGLPRPLAGSPPDLRDPPAGCAFAPRCELAEARCHVEEQVLRSSVACWKASR